MKDNPSWLTPKQAASLSGYTPRHIQNLIVGGKLSATREDGRYYIDKAEFFRVFPDAHVKEKLGIDAKSSEDFARMKAEMEVEFLREAIADKDKQNEFLKKQLENFTHEKNQMLEAINSHSRLLEHKENQLAEKEQPKDKKGLLERFMGKKD